MKRFNKRAISALTQAVFVCAAHSAYGAPPTAEDFVRAPTFEDVRISPSGKRLAWLTGTQDGRTALMVIDLPIAKNARVVAGYRDAEITRFGWVNDDRLIYDAVDFANGVEVRMNAAGSFAVNHDGTDSTNLIAFRPYNSSTGTHIKSRVLTHQWHWYRTIDDGSNDVWAYERKENGLGEWTGNKLARLNTLNGLVRSQGNSSPEHAHNWLFGPGGEPAVVGTTWDGRSKLLFRPAPDKDWTVLQDEAAVSGDTYSPEFLEADGRLLVEANNGRDVTALYEFDTTKQQLGKEPLVAVKGFDLHSTLETDPQTRKVVGVHFRADHILSYWFNDDLDRIQRSMDASLPSRVNRLGCGRCESSRFIVVHSYSDKQPGEYYVYDRQQKKLELLGAARPWLPEASQGARSFHRFSARDGLEIPLYVTHPPDSKPNDALPAVVLVHGGPWVRGTHRGWRAEAQFLATRGYRVLEPEFRGSTGYGAKLFNAGLKQWGRAMQDDLVDAVRWAAKQGLVDDKRVCIMGTSYGGYAALMGPIRDPSAYRCAISFAGVTDIELRYTAWGSDLTEQTSRYILQPMMGDPEKDVDLLRAASPLLRVKEIKIPVLLAHGEQDRRVTIEHARKFVSAAKEAGVPVDYKSYELEGHGWVIPADEVDFYKRVEAFLAKHLGSTNTASAPNAKP